MPKSPKAKKSSPLQTVKSKAKPTSCKGQSAKGPTYADVTAMLDTLVLKSVRNINDAPHAFADLEPK